MSISHVALIVNMVQEHHWEYYAGYISQRIVTYLLYNQGYEGWYDIEQQSKQINNDIHLFCTDT